VQGDGRQGCLAGRLARDGVDGHVDAHQAPDADGAEGDDQQQRQDDGELDEGLS
jgi:hypothetical protein